MNIDTLRQALNKDCYIKCTSKEETRAVLEICETLGLRWAYNNSNVLDQNVVNSVFMSYPKGVYIVIRSFSVGPRLSTRRDIPRDISTGWDAQNLIEMFSKLDSDQVIEERSTLTVKIDYVQFPCPKCGEPMKALFRLDNQYCPRGCN